ncbi:hypothetical protein ACQP1P_28840 [Dactylosporangium sp. CA-052675]|uniref:hypothetical protein n=1 Tax=Dactylosporangium sp. CA-052675 TaxID=3239927 RepID=UPI003D8E9315
MASPIDPAPSSRRILVPGGPSRGRRRARAVHRFRADARARLTACALARAEREHEPVDRSSRDCV